MLLVEELPVALGGNVHEYEAMLADAGTEYVCVVNGHTVNVPVGT